MMHKLKRAFELRNLILKASRELIIAHRRIHKQPFKNLAPELGQPNQSAAHTMTDAQLKTAKEIGLVIRRIAPFLKCKCLAQAVAAQKLLTEKHIPSQLYLGVHKQEEMMKAHAWLKIDDLFITGKPGHSAFTKVICFHKVFP